VLGSGIDRVSTVHPPFIGVIGSGGIGRDPFDRRSWSGSSYFFFSALRERGLLHRAFGVEVPRPQRWWLMGKNVHQKRDVWRENFYLDTAYRDALTAEIGRRIRPDDAGYDFLQIGSFYNVPRLLQGRTRCVLYSDGNLAEASQSSYFPRGVSARTVDRALAYEREVANQVDRIFTFSDYLRDSFIHQYSVHPDRVVTIGAGVNLDTLPDPVDDKDYGSKDILFIGIDFSRKGGWKLLEAFQGVRSVHPTARLHIVGPRRLDVPTRLRTGVELHGFIDRTTDDGRRKSEALFRRSCLFVMPSLYEPFGIAPLEAMTYNIPCVVTGRWALAEMVTPGVNGDLVEVGSSADIEAKVTTLLRDPEALARMGRAGRERVLARYTWQNVVERLVRNR
jgi:starch synthase